MLNLKEHSTVGDQIMINYVGPGYYSAVTNKPLQDSLLLKKIAEEYIDIEDVEWFCKLNKYKIKPYLINDMTDIPLHWDVLNQMNEKLNEEY